MKSVNRFAVGITGIVALSAISAGVAFADPSGNPQYRRLAGVGSDTSQDVMGAIAQTITSGTSGITVGSYDATGGGSVTTKDPATVTNTNRSAKCTFTRPNGSGAGRTQLDNDTNATGASNSVTTDGAAYNGANGCTDFARSSSVAAANANGGRLTYVPFAVDTVDFAITATSIVPRSLTTAQLTSIYHCDPNFVGTSAAHPLGKDSLNTYDIVPVLPNISSGTRSFWLGKVGLHDGGANDADNVANNACIDDQYVPSPGGTGTTVIEEHDARSLNDHQLVPFSVAKWLGEQSGLVPSDTRGRSLLGNIDGTNPESSQSSFALKRNLYNVIPTSMVATAPFSTTFVGSNSLVCKDTADITKYFFGTSPSLPCGDTTTTS